jgi:alkyl hydroperoxide reductase subunit AhpC
MSQVINRAHVTQAAPDFKAEAVLPDGEFATISTADYKGKW